MIVSFSPPFCVFSLPFLHDLRHEITHLFGGTFLHLPRDVSVGAQCEACIKVTEHAGHRFYVYAVLERQGCECVTQVVKSQVFQPGVFQNFLVDVDHRVRVVHLACFWRWEHPRIAEVFLVLRD